MAKKTYKSPEQARTAILDAAQRVVGVVGPAGMRISAVAKEAGMAHPNVLHHFGSRDGLLSALAARVNNKATKRITRAIESALLSSPDERISALTKVLDSAYEGDEGKIAVWMAMSGVERDLSENLEQVVDMSHKLRHLVHKDVNIQSTRRLVLMVTLALIGEVVSGKAIEEAMGFSQEDNPAQFRQWLAEILLKLSDKELETRLSK